MSARTTDAEVESYLVMGGTVRYATRDTLDDAQALSDTDRQLIEKFGPPRIETHIVRLPTRRKEPAYE